MRNLSLRVQVVLVTAILITVLIFFITSTLSSNYREFYMNQLLQNMNQSLNLTAGQLVADLTDPPADWSLTGQVYHLASTVGARATFIDTYGVVVADSEVTDVAAMDNHLTRDEIKEALDSGYGQSRRYSETLGTDMLYSAMLLKDTDQNKLGIIRLAMPAAEIDQLVRSQVLRVGEITMAGVMMIMLLTWLLIGRLLNPLEVLHRSFNHMTEGEYGVLLNVRPTSIETYDLLISFNRMSEQLQQNFESIRSKEVELKTILNTMESGFLFIDQHGMVRLTNPALRNLLTLSDQHLNKSYLLSLRNVKLIEAVENGLENPTFTSFETLLQNGLEQTHTQVVLTPLFADEEREQFRGVILLFHDITILRKMELNRRDLIANVSHELRTPVTTIAGFTETILDMDRDDPQIYEFLTIISKETERLRKLIEDLLELSRLESGQLRMDISRVELSEIILDLIEESGPTAQKKNITVENRVAEGQVVLADYFRVEQILRNLFSNALKYTGDGGKIVFSCEKIGERLAVHIEDNGIGIPADKLTRVTERFYRTDQGRTHQDSGGYGLGLAIVKHLLQAQDGQLNIRSREGEGTVVTVSFPQA